MLTQTSENAIRLLIYLAVRRSHLPVTPRSIAEPLNMSPTSTAKICQLLAKADIVRTLRGAQGGVILNRSPERVTLRQIVEACQGVVVGDFCQDATSLKSTCGFHQAMADIHQALVGALERWTLADLSAKPAPGKALAGKVNCKMGMERVFPGEAPRG